jgi:predicted short-subunit dehydrogenase-like oxidoreductase (DUF2520 family)
MKDILCHRLGVVGAGRAGQALGHSLAPRCATPPLFYDLIDAQLERAVAAIPRAEAASEIGQLTRTCDLIAISVSDDAIAGVVGSLGADFPIEPAPFVFQISGRCGAGVLQPLHAAGAAVAAIHPVMTFIGDPAMEAARMQGAPFAVTAPDDRSLGLALKVVEAAGSQAFVVGEDSRALYHAALCHSANHLVTLISGGATMLRAAGVEGPSYVLTSLVQAALENALSGGMHALSGPLLRGDAETIENHLVAIERQAPEILPDYIAMARGTLRALEATGAGRVDAISKLVHLLDAHRPE